MSTHDDDFWGDQAEWKPSGNVPRIDADRTRPIDAVRKGWKNLLSSGANPTREHGIVRPDTSRLDARPAAVLGDATPMVSVRPDMFDDLDTDLPLDSFSYVDASDVPLDSTTHDADHGVPHVDDNEWEAEFALTPRRSSVGVDPLIARLGTLAVVGALFVPVIMSVGSGDSTDIIETAVAAEAPVQTIELLPQTSTVVDATETSTATPASQVPVVATPVNDAPAASDQATVEVATTTVGSSAPAATEPAASETTTAQVNEQAASVEGSSISDSAEVSTPAERVARLCAIDYEVVSGDFWIRIADGAGVPLAELLEANGVSASTPIYPGSSICLPAGSSIPSPPPETTTTTTVAPTTTAATTTTTTVAPTTTTATTVPASSGEVQQIIRNVWPDDLEDRAREIAHRESRYVPTAKNYCCYGIFQIYWDVHKSWLDDIGITSAQQLYDPETNARAAYALYQRAGGWGPWAL